MGKWRSLLRKMWVSILTFVAFVLVLLLCGNILRSILWKNSNEMGLSLVKNYSSAEEQNLKTCEAVLNICMDYMAEQEGAGAAPEEIRRGLYPFMSGITDLYGEDQIQVYGRVGGGVLISSRPEIEGMGDYDVTGKEGYQGAAAAKGKAYAPPSIPTRPPAFRW